MYVYLCINRTFKSFVNFCFGISCVFRPALAKNGNSWPIARNIAWAYVSTYVCRCLSEFLRRISVEYVPGEIALSRVSLLLVIYNCCCAFCFLLTSRMLSNWIFCLLCFFLQFIYTWYSTIDCTFSKTKKRKNKTIRVPPSPIHVAMLYRGGCMAVLWYAPRPNIETQLK